MSASSSTSSPGSTVPRPRLGFMAVLSRALRLAVMLVIVAFGLMLLQTYRTMWHEAPAAAEKIAKDKAATTVFEPGRDAPLGSEKIMDALLRPGAWSLGESNWSLALIELSGAGDEARLQSLGHSLTTGAEPAALEKKLLAWLRHVRPREVNGCLVYNATIGSVRVRAVTEKRGRGERPRLLQMVWRQGGSARLLEASPAAASAAHEKKQGHLLSLPDGIASLARRWDDTGRLSCEVLGPASMQECLRSWAAAGWTAEKSGEAQGPAAFIVVRKGGRIIQLYPLDAGRPGSSPYLLLTALTAEP